MKTFLIGMLTLAGSAQACIDPPTPISLTNSSFENEPMQVSSSGLSLSNGTFFYSEEKKEWCIREGIKDTCQLATQLKLTDDKSGKIIGVFNLNNSKKTLTLKPVKNADKTNFEIDSDGAFLVFNTDNDPKSDNYGQERFITTAYDPKEGTLGKVTSTYQRGTKGLGPSGKNDKIDLRTAKVHTGCGGVKEDEPRKKKSELKTGGDTEFTK